MARRRRPTGVVVVVAAVTTLVVGIGAYVLTRHDSTSTPTVPNSDTSAGTTVAPGVPAGAVDLGQGVHVPLPRGWSVTGTAGQVTTVSDGTLSIDVRVTVREPGSPRDNMMAAVQDYVDSTDSTVVVIGYAPTVEVLFGEVEQADTLYSTLDDHGASGSGTIKSLLRADGLSVVFDVHGDAKSTDSFPAGAYDDFVSSVKTAPPVGVPKSSPQKPGCCVMGHVTSGHLFVDVKDPMGFTATSGFGTVKSGGGDALVSTGTDDVEMVLAGGQTDIDAVRAAVAAHVATTYSGVAYDPVTTVGAHDDARKRAEPAQVVSADPVVHQRVGWKGTYTNGRPAAGVVDYAFFQPTGEAIMMFHSWYTDTATSGVPDAAAYEFMFRTMFDSFLTLEWDSPGRTG